MTTRFADRTSQRGGCLAKLFVLGALFMAFAVVCWIFLLPVAVTRAIESRTGFPVAITSLSVNPFTARVAVDGLVITNPPAQFSEPNFVKLRSLRADIELFSVFSDRLVVEEAVVDIEQVTLVKNAQHEGNGVLFGQRIVGESSPEKPDPSKPEPAPAVDKPAARKEFLIRHLQLRLDKVVLVDAAGSKPAVKEVNVAFNQTYKDVTTPTEIATPIVAHLIANGSSIGDYAGELGRKALEAAKKTGTYLKETGKKAGESLKDIFQSISDKVKK